MKFCLLCAVGLLLLCPRVQSQESKVFPTEDEVRLVINQTSRAVETYADTSEKYQRLSESEVDAANDKRVIDGLRTMTKAFNTKPQAFNSRFGFEFILLLDDGSRNAALCHADAISKGLKATLVHDTQTSQDYLQIAQECTSASDLLYTVSENAAALYQRYVDGEEDLANQAFDAMQKCVATLKQKNGK